MNMTAPACELCAHDGGQIVWADAQCRVVLVGGAEGAAWPGFCRVIWHAHVAEMSDLPPAQRLHLMTVVWAVERALRELQQPDKINLASLGNVVPHLHWHVIPRWHDDRCFPQPVWASPQRDDRVRALPSPASLQRRIIAALTESSQDGSESNAAPG